MPQHLWFKQKFVASILDGTKTTTVEVMCPAFKVGDRIPFAVGPRTPFCTVEIDAIERIAVDSLDMPHRIDVRKLYGQVRYAWRLTFHVVSVPLPASRGVRGYTEGMEANR